MHYRCEYVFEPGADHPTMEQFVAVCIANTSPHYDIAIKNEVPTALFIPCMGVVLLCCLLWRWSQVCQSICDSYAKGLEQGLQEGAEVVEEALEECQRESRKEGHDEGRRKLLKELAEAPDYLLRGRVLRLCKEEAVEYVKVDSDEESDVEGDSDLDDPTYFNTEQHRQAHLRDQRREEGYLSGTSEGSDGSDDGDTDSDDHFSLSSPD